MMGYIILAVFIFWVVSTFGAFIFGYTKGRAKEHAEQKEEALRKAARNLKWKKKKSWRRSLEMRRIKSLNFPPVLAGLVLIALLTACATRAKIEYVREIPVVAFPVFPPPDCVEYDEETDTVSMPLWYWQKIAEYKIDVDTARDYLTILRGQADIERMKVLVEKGKKKK